MVNVYVVFVLTAVVSVSLAEEYKVTFKCTLKEECKCKETPSTKTCTPGVYRHGTCALSCPYRKWGSFNAWSEEFPCHFCGSSRASYVRQRTCEGETTYSNNRYCPVCPGKSEDRKVEMCKKAPCEDPVTIEHHSCMDIKRCNGDTDGEYWLYSKVLGGAVKIYCHNMTSGNPKEFVTLAVPNKGVYPKKSRLWCGQEVPYLVAAGLNSDATWTYNKIRINIGTMEINRSDRTFMSNTGPGAGHDYGEAHDCYNLFWSQPKTKECGPKGTFRIDTTGTGFILKQPVHLTSGGYKAAAFLRQESDKVYVLTCGGWCGYCQPTIPLKLKLDPNEVITPETAASVPGCDKKQ